MFRGQANAEWPLVPAAFRYSLGDESERFYSRSNLRQIDFELRSLRSFFDFADTAGLPLPEDSQALRTKLDEICEPSLQIFREGRVVWPPREFWSLLAIAQHHGIPTRLLDWSWSAYAAAYFAAVDLACARLQGPKELAVWAYAVIGHDLLDGRAADLASELKIVRSPYAGNKNLAAQQGVHLLLWPRSNDLTDELDASSVQHHLEAIHASWRRQQCHVLIRFTLASRHAPELLWRLARQLIHGAALFPGYDGVARVWHEQRYWNTSEGRLPLA